MTNEAEAADAEAGGARALGDWPWWRMALVALLIVGLLVLAWHVFLRSDPARQTGPQLPPPATVAITEAKRETWDGTLTATGTFTPVRGVEVAAELPGAVSAILFDAGDYVAQGTLLVRLGTSSERAQIRRLEAQLEQARAAAERADRLIERGAISEAEAEQAVANRDAIAAQISEIRAAIAKKEIRAPFRGRLGIRLVNKGQYLAAGTPIAQLVQPSPLFLNFDLPEGSIGTVRPGLRVEAEIEGLSERDFSGEITAINPDVAPGTRNFTVQATLPNPQGRIKPGQFASVTVDTGAAKSVIAVPATAISFNAYGSSVFLAEDPSPEQRKALQRMREGRGEESDGGLFGALGAWLFGGGDEAGAASASGAPDGEKGSGEGNTERGAQFIASRVFVETGARRGLDIEVLDGLEAGQRVVVSGQIKLVDGTPIIPAPESALEGVDPVPQSP